MKKLLVFLVLLVMLVMATVVVNAQTGSSYALTWWTIDGGGSQNIGAGGYELSGTVGQPDPGKAIGGAGYELSGGYWSGATQVSYQNFLPTIVR
jgi:hypothetical protein